MDLDLCDQDVAYYFVLHLIILQQIDQPIEHHHKCFSPHKLNLTLGAQVVEWLQRMPHRQPTPKYSPHVHVTPSLSLSNVSCLSTAKIKVSMPNKILENKLKFKSLTCTL